MADIKKLPELKLFNTDNGGLALTTEGAEWFGQVTEVINQLVDEVAELRQAIKQLSKRGKDNE